MRVLFLDLDTLRPDHLGCYGYERDTSPNLDGIAARGVRFDRYYCPNAPCLPSRASLTTGMLGLANGVVGHDLATADLRTDFPNRNFRSEVAENSLFCMFRKAGLHTASVSTFAERHSAWWFIAGLNEQYNVGEGGHESAEQVTPVALDWLKRNAGSDNWMLHVNYWDPHTPYRAPAEYGNPFKNVKVPAFFSEDTFKKHLQTVGPHGLNEISMWDDSTSPRHPNHLGKATNMREYKQVIDGYDTGIHFMDSHIGMLIDELKSQGVYDDMAIIVTSDHGENFGELGIYGEHATADEATCRIPMIISWPGGAQNATDDNWRTNVDLVPTLAELFHINKKGYWDGVGYADAILTGKSGNHADCVVLTQCAHVVQRSVRFDNYLYIRTLHNGYHLFDDEMLFDLATDPYEQHNIAGAHPDICLAGAGRIQNWQFAFMKKHAIDRDPLYTALIDEPCHSRGALPAYLERLRATGREEGARALARLFPEKAAQ